MIHPYRVIFYITLIICYFPVISYAQDEWRDEMNYLIYSPRFFGPNAFPIPELRNGKVSDRYEIEFRGEYHFYEGDRTKDLYGRIFLPFAKGRAGLELSGVIIEDYEMSDETKAERHAAENYPVIRCYGDLIISSFYQLVRSDKWIDMVLSVNLKTASGGRLCDARFTDAATYWFDLTAGRDLIRNRDHTAYIRLQGLAGFYCWMTNDMVHRQNDAILFGAGLGAGFKNASFTADYSGFYGYQHIGDYPISIRYKLNYEYRKNILSLRFRHGMKDNLYDSYSVAYIRCF